MSEPGSPTSRAVRLRARIGAGVGHGWRLLSNAVPAFFAHHGTQLAASMSYYGLFSVFPLAIVLTAAAGLILDDPQARADAVDFLLKELPLSESQGRSEIETLLDGVTANSGTVGLVGVVGLLITSSGLISAARNSVNIIFEEEVQRGAIRGKALDLLLVIGLGALFAISFAATLLGSLDVTLGGRVGDAIEALTGATGTLLPLSAGAVVFTMLYRVLPTSRPSFRDIWPGVLFASLAYELLKRAFSLYLEHFADYSAVYGSLGAVIAFMFFVWLASIVFLLGAEMAAIWPGVRAGRFDRDDQGGPFSQRLRDALLGLFRRNRVDPR